MINHVKGSIGEITYNSIISYLENDEISLWGTEQPRGYTKQCVDCMLYHDLEGLGYIAIEQVLSDNKLPHNTMHHNSHAIRNALRPWAENLIRLGSSADWNSATRNLPNIPVSLHGANLWIDSFDVQIKGRNSIKTTDPKWSYKLNAPGRRYMVIQNGRRKFVRIWGGHSPKIHDGSWLETHREEIDEKFKGTRFVGDQHFAKGKRLLLGPTNDSAGIKFYTNPRVPKAAKQKGQKRKAEEVDDDEEIAIDEFNMTKAQKQFKKDHAKLRARVETPFSWLKTILSLLQGSGKMVKIS